MSVAPERRTVAYVACLMLAVVRSACGMAPADHGDGAAQPGAVITVGSFDFPESVLLLAVLSAVSARLSTISLRALDARVELRGQDPRLVAESWLRTQGLASTGEVSR
jgi:glycine betaine/choline ABC-type transport system substrate-binding protein